MKPIALIIVALCINAASQAQLSAGDSLFISRLNELCTLNPTQQIAIDTLMKETAIQLRQVDKEISKVSRSSMNDDEKAAMQQELRKQKKDIIDGRDQTIAFFLDERQRTIFFEQIKPVKPAILHMGINHDRASCTICVAK